MDCCSTQPIRIGNASGAVGDGIDQVYRLAKEGNVNAITADYLAEFNIAWKAIEMMEHPELGYEPNFLHQLAWNDGEAARLIAEQKIKVVHNGGALAPKALALKVDEYLRQCGITSLKVAWVSGDNMTSQIRMTGASFEHLDVKGMTLTGEDKSILAANAYTGQRGIIAALKSGADIVICGRCCDASPVMALASWWHGWDSTDYDKLAGGLMAGHVIECGAYTTGGNYCGFQEIAKTYQVGYPIAEIYKDGTSIITKADHSNGAVTVDTVKAQYVYEIQGPYYFNTDVIAKIDNGVVEEVGLDRIRVSGIVGLQPPPTTKLAISLFGGYQAEISAFAVGLDIEAKLKDYRSNILRELNKSDFHTISIEPYGSIPHDPKSQAEGTVMFRLFVQAPTNQAIAKFKQALFFNGQAGYCGLHLSMDWRTLEPRAFVKYFPCLIKQELIQPSVHFVSSEDSTDAPPATDYAVEAVKQESYETANPVDLATFGKTVKRPLGDLVFGRSGDKGGNANVGLWVRDPAAYPWLQSFMTIPRMIELLGNDWSAQYSVERFEMPNLLAVHFLVRGILQEGVSSSSIIDGLAKSFSEFVRSRHVELPRNLVGNEDALRQMKRAAAAALSNQ